MGRAEMGEYSRQGGLASAELRMAHSRQRLIGHDGIERKKGCAGDKGRGVIQESDGGLP